MPLSDFRLFIDGRRLAVRLGEILIEPSWSLQETALETHTAAVAAGWVVTDQGPGAMP